MANYFKMHRVAEGSYVTHEDTTVAWENCSYCQATAAAYRAELGDGSMTGPPLPPQEPVGGTRQERRLPPALEEKAYGPHGDDGEVRVGDLLDWLYGTDPANKYGAPFSGLVKRVERRMKANLGGVFWWDALRAELREEASNEHLCEYREENERLRAALEEIAGETWNPAIGLPGKSIPELHVIARNALRDELGEEAAWSEPLHLKNVNSSEAPMSPE